MLPFLFSLAEDFLSQSSLKMVRNNVLSPMSANRSVHAPTHILYVDDILLFCHCSSRNIRNIFQFLSVYGEILG